jgi:hypothetical protein
MLEIVANFTSFWQSVHIEFRQNPASRFLTQRRSRYLQLKECGNRTPSWGNCCIAGKLIIVKLTVEVHRDIHQFSWLGQWSVMSLQRMWVENAEWDHVWRQRNRGNKIEEPKQKPQKQRRRREHKGNTREDNPSNYTVLRPNQTRTKMTGNLKTDQTGYMTKWQE